MSILPAQNKHHSQKNHQSKESSFKKVINKSLNLTCPKRAIKILVRPIFKEYSIDEFNSLMDLIAFLNPLK